MLLQKLFRRSSMVIVPDVVYMVSSRVVRQYLIRDNDKLTVIDTGLSGDDARLFDCIKKELSLRPANITRILITHADGDHYGSAKFVKAACDAPIMASAVEAAAIREGKSSRELAPRGIMKYVFPVISRLFKAEPTPVDAIVQNGEVIPVADGLLVLSTPGHTPGHTSFFLQKYGVLFAGDSIRLIDGKPAPSGNGNTWNEEMAQNSFNLQMALKPEFICAGHMFYRVP
jgi:glyoxylase-like metal-dependent hydrolase (beta-lactamase superfamily II)